MKQSAFPADVGRVTRQHQILARRRLHAVTIARRATRPRPYAAPNYRRGIAEAMTDVTEALIGDDWSAPPRDDLRMALREWTFSKAIRAGNNPPADLAPAIRWLEHNTIQMADLVGDQGPVLARRMLDRISRKQDGTVAGPPILPTASARCSATPWSTPARQVCFRSTR